MSKSKKLDIAKEEIKKDIEELESEIKEANVSEDAKKIMEQIKEVVIELTEKSLAFVNEKFEQLKDDKQRKELIDAVASNVTKVIAEGHKQVKAIVSDERVVATVEKTKEIAEIALEKTKKTFKEISSNQKVIDATEELSAKAKATIEKTTQVVTSEVDKYPELKKAAKATKKIAKKASLVVVSGLHNVLGFLKDKLSEETAVVQEVKSTVEEEVKKPKTVKKTSK